MPKMDVIFTELEERLGYYFRRKSLLRRALTHRSCGKINNERLEFLGDALLQGIIAHFLYEYFPTAPEGDLSRLRSQWVSQHSLYVIAQQLLLQKWIFLGRGENKSGGQNRPSILSDTLEAVIAAVFLDADFDETYQIVCRLYRPMISSLGEGSFVRDPKTKLQEYLQGKKLGLPAYSVLLTKGADHERLFEVSCRVAKLKLESRGQGTSRKAAEQSAAAACLLRLQE